MSAHVIQAYHKTVITSMNSIRLSTENYFQSDAEQRVHTCLCSLSAIQVCTTRLSSWPAIKARAAEDKHE